MMAKKSKARGFSLIEMSIAMVCATLVIAAATSATQGLYKQLRALEQQASANDDAKVLLDIMVSEIVQAGGGSIRPWEALSPSCSVTGFALPTCSGQTDQVHVAQVGVGTQLTITAYSGSGSATVQTVGGVCPVTATDGYPSAGRAVLVFPNAPVAGGGWQMKLCTPLTGGACGCALSDIANAVTVNPGAALAAGDWTSGVIAPGQTVSYYVNPTMRTLSLHSDTNGDGIIDDLLMDTDVYDLQLQFGFDVAPVDGAFDGVWRNTITPVTEATSLRMARVGLVVGADAASRTRNSTVSLFGATTTGPNGTFLVSASGAVALRNLLVFF